MDPAVDHYFDLLSAAELPSDSFCLTAVQGLTVDEALERFDACPGWAIADLAELGQRAIAVYPDELATVIADEVDGWVLLAENNGRHGAKTSVLQRLSAGTVVASAFWNVELDSTISLARDGEVLAAFDFVIGREHPAALVSHLDGLTFTYPYRMTAEALAYVERVSGVRLTAEWAAAKHPASVIGDLWRFHTPVAWLDVNAPDVLATPGRSPSWPGGSTSTNAPSAATSTTSSSWTSRCAQCVGGTAGTACPRATGCLR